MLIFYLIFISDHLVIIFQEQYLKKNRNDIHSPSMKSYQRSDDYRKKKNHKMSNDSRTSISYIYLEFSMLSMHVYFEFER